MDSPHSLTRVKDGPTPECLRLWATTGMVINSLIFLTAWLHHKVPVTTAVFADSQ